MYQIFEVAKAILNVEGVTHKKLQKLCYYAQGWHLGLTGKKLFDENLEAWVHGPVCPILYDKYKIYGYNIIPKEENNVDNELLKFVEQICRIYKNLDGDDLEAKTHREMPWKKARGNLEDWEPSDNIINIKDIENFFKEQYNKLADA